MSTPEGRPAANSAEWPAYWQARIDAAQALKTVWLSGATYQRTPYGTEVDDPRPKCRDCFVAIGQLHVPSCCVELCPCCGEQFISCDCERAQ